MAMYLKQIESVGCPCWRGPHWSAELPPNAESAGLEHIAVFILASDQGPDQKATDKRISAETVSELRTWYIRQFCLQHCGHLM
eukprot:6476514-Alexandrium_andersonii.AAC.1